MSVVIEAPVGGLYHIDRQASTLALENVLKSTIWISYDLGIRGNYSGLYAWLDSHGAKECGDSVAFLDYEHQGNLRDEVSAELKSVLAGERNARIYLIYREKTTNKNKGVFLLGGRRAPPWTGYSPKANGAVDEEG